MTTREHVLGLTDRYAEDSLPFVVGGLPSANTDGLINGTHHGFSSFDNLSTKENLVDSGIPKEMADLNKLK